MHAVGKRPRNGKWMCRDAFIAGTPRGALVCVCVYTCRRARGVVIGYPWEYVCWDIIARAASSRRRWERKKNWHDNINMNRAPKRWPVPAFDAQIFVDLLWLCLCLWWMICEKVNGLLNFSKWLNDRWIGRLLLHTFPALDDDREP